VALRARPRGAVAPGAVIHLESGDSPGFRIAFGAVGALLLAGAAALALRAHRLGWPPGSVKVVLLPAAIGIGMLLQAALAPRRVGPPRRR